VVVGAEVGVAGASVAVNASAGMTVVTLVASSVSVAVGSTI
jgi:hypothetical protein